MRLSMQPMTYHPSIAHLENSNMSYGTLGIINTLVTDKRLVKWDLFYVNLVTIIRNNIERDVSDQTVLDNTLRDVQQLVTYIDTYCNKGSMVVCYAQSNTRQLIPEHNRRPDIKSRVRLEGLTEKLIRQSSMQHGRLKTALSLSNVTVFEYVDRAQFIYMKLALLQKAEFRRNTNVALLSHSSVDFFMFDLLFQLNVIESHTGRVLSRSDIPKKVFKHDKIPFNKTALKLFGDKDLMKPIINKKPLALDRLKGINLLIRTDRELRDLAISRLGVTEKQLDWKL